MSADRGLTLYSDAFWISPYVFTCFVALREKGAVFEVKELQLQTGDQRRPEYVKETWTGRVPSLVDGEFRLTESFAILEYLEETFPPPAHARLFPEDRQARARARQLMSWLRSDETLPVRGERSAEVIFYDRPQPSLSMNGVACAKKSIELAERFVRGAGPLFGAWSIADAELAFFLHRLWKDELLPDALRAYAKAQWARPSVAEYVAHERAAFVPYG